MSSVPGSFGTTSKATATCGGRKRQRQPALAAGPSHPAILALTEAGTLLADLMKKTAKISKKLSP